MTYRPFSVRWGTVFALLLGLLASTPSLATTYNFAAPNYTGINGAGPPAYTTAMHPAGSITTANPLQANLINVDVGPTGSNLIQSWNFDDGLTPVYTPANSSVIGFYVTTDAAGNITKSQFAFGSPKAPNTLGQLMNRFGVAPPSGPSSNVIALTNYKCVNVDASRGDLCTASQASPSYSFATVASDGAFTTVAASPSTTVLETSISPSTVGQAVTFTATVSGNAPTGSVTFNDGSTGLCSNVVLSSAKATCTTSTLTAGSHNITAVYGGDTNNAASISAVLVQVVTAVAPPPAAVVPAPSLGVFGSILMALTLVLALALRRRKI